MTSNNTALLPASSVVLGSGCTASGTCPVSLTPQALQSGVVDLTFAVTDGAHRTGSAVLVVTVNKPAPPTLTVTGQGTQEVKLGGLVTPATVVANGTGTMTITVSSSNSALLPNSKRRPLRYLRRRMPGDHDAALGRLRHSDHYGDGNRCVWPERSNDCDSHC